MSEWLTRIVLVGVILAPILALYSCQGRLVFLPEAATAPLTPTPGHVGLGYEDVYFSGADGVRRHGWFVPHPDATATVLICHGNAGNISGRLETIRFFHELGVKVFIFDYQGYGLSEGSPGEFASYSDARAAWSHLVNDRGIASTSIVLFGRSLGGAVIAKLATEVEPAAVILESTFTSVPDVAAEIYPWLPTRWFLRIRYDTADRIGEIDEPLLIVHSVDDEIIPFAHGEKLHRLAPQAEFMRLRGGHNDAHFVSADAYRDGLFTFLSRRGLVDDPG